MMTATATVHSAALPHRATPPITPHGTAPAGHAAQRPTSVWDERARKMGFPPSTR